MARYMLKQVTHMLAQRVINRQNRFGLGLTHRLGLLEQIAYWARVDLVLGPGGFREEARQVGLIGTVEDAAGDVGHALIGKYHKASQIVLKMSKLLSVFKQIPEGNRVKLVPNFEGRRLMAQALQSEVA